MAATVAGFGTASAQSASPSPAIVPLTVVSMSYRRWAAGVGLKFIVRDVNQPDSPIYYARAVVEPTNAAAGAALYATSDSSGTANLLVPVSGVYHVRILSIGYDRLEFNVRLEAECQQVVEVYVARSVDSPGDVVYTSGHEPKRKWSMTPTAGRAVLTTCPPLPNER